MTQPAHSSTGISSEAASRAGHIPQTRTNPAPRLALAHLLLSNFRSYVSGELQLSGRPVVLTGANGAGKTNILDAISLLSPGRGLRGAALADHIRKGPAENSSHLWAVSARVLRNAQLYELGTGLSQNAGTRQVRLNGATMQSSADLGELIQMVWLTPFMDRLFMESASGRRRFLDRLTLGFFAGHARVSLRYEQAMRERARLLKFGPRDPAWLDGLEDQMAENGVALSIARAESADRLNRALHERSVVAGFPSAHLSLSGDADELIVAHGSNAIQEFRDRFARSRLHDAESGRTAFGPHLTDLAARHMEKRSDARICSTGEQKALLISIVLAQARELSHINGGIAPILLLDEIAAHLDAVRRAALFEEIFSLGAQAWITGTDGQTFDCLRGRADLFDIVDSRIYPITE